MPFEHSKHSRKFRENCCPSLVNILPLETSTKKLLPKCHLNYMVKRNFLLFLDPPMLE